MVISFVYAAASATAVRPPGAPPNLRVMSKLSAALQTSMSTESLLSEEDLYAVSGVHSITDDKLSRRNFQRRAQRPLKLTRTVELDS